MALHLRSLRRMKSFLDSEDGVSGTEYAIMLALIVLAAAGAIRGIGERMHNVYDIIDQNIPDV